MLKEDNDQEGTLQYSYLVLKRKFTFIRSLVKEWITFYVKEQYKTLQETIVGIEE